MLNEKEKIARKKLCLPLDGLNSLDEVKQIINELSPYVGLFKIGKESFTRFGHEIVKIIHDNGSEVFLDLKYHDIPNTVKGAAKAATELGVYMFNVHAFGGKEMMKAAIQGVEEVSLTKNLRKPKIIAVTILTSIDKEIMNNELNILGSVEDQVLKFAMLAKDSGLNGIVCSAADLKYIKDQLPHDFIYVTPGIKGINTNAGSDQKRIFTPGNAIEDGSTILVVGRAITHSDNKIKAVKEILEDMAIKI